MSIKQNGGVFGRNPTFNDVNVDGNLIFPDNSKAIFGTGSGDLEIFHDGGNSYIKDVGTNDLRIWADNPNIASLSGNKYFYGNSGVAELFYNGSKRFYTTSGGSTIVGNLGFASGDGIDFSATAGSGTSEVLDDYEEGAFSPTLENVTITYDSQSGTYTKIGRDVFCYGFINVATIDNADPSSVAIGGLPFTPSGVACSLSLSNGQGSTPLFGSKLTDTTGGIVVSGNILPSNVASQYVQAYNVANVIANTGGSFYFALHYTT